MKLEGLRGHRMRNTATGYDSSVQKPKLRIKSKKAKRRIKTFDLVTIRLPDTLQMDNLHSPRRDHSTQKEGKPWLISHCSAWRKTWQSNSSTYSARNIAACMSLTRFTIPPAISYSP